MNKLTTLALVAAVVFGVTEASARGHMGMGGCANELKQNHMFYFGSGCCEKPCDPCAKPCDPCEKPCEPVCEPVCDPCDPCAPCCPEIHGLLW